MTLNKSQGQSLKYVGVNVREEIFGHGQPWSIHMFGYQGQRVETVKVLLPDTSTGVAD